MGHVLDIAPLTLGIDPRVFGIMTRFASTSREQLESSDDHPRKGEPRGPESACYGAEILVTAFYRPGGRGGFLVRVCHDELDLSHYLHLAVVTHGACDDLLVYEWMERWSRTPRTKTWPRTAFRRAFNTSDEVVGHLFKRLTEHLSSPALPPAP